MKIFNLLKKSAFFVIIAAGVVTTLSACNLGLIFSPLPDTVQQQVEQAVEYGLDGIIVYVDMAGKAPALYAAGWENRENQVPADPHALFKIASISKLYIAAAAAKLVNTQIISLESTLAEHLPELVGRIENAEKITVRMMLQHRSGIPDFLDAPDYPWADPPNTNAATLELVLDKPSEFSPGWCTKYSNTNYLLIGNIFDRVLGYSHRQYIEEKILSPLNLSNTFGLLSDIDIEDLMSGYFVDYGPDIKYNDFVAPGGSMVGTAEDVGVFLRALIDGSLLNSGEQAIYSSIYEYEHTGELPGYLSIARYHEDIDAVVIQFANTSGGNTWSTMESVYSRIIRIIR